MDAYEFQKGRYAFAVCRIEPENNIHLILDAFRDAPPFPVAIVGNWDHGDYGRELREKHRNAPSVHLLDPIYDTEKLNAIRSRCSLYLHGHSCGGTNPSLVEAMFLGLPIAAFDVNFNRATTEGKAFYFNSSEQLRALCETLSDEDVAKNAAAMKEIALRRYTWARISDLYARLF